MIELQTIQPASTLHLVELTKAAEQSTGGIYLPETMQQNSVEATVLRTGGGWRIPGEDRYALMWALPGWIVTFAPHNFRPLYRGSREGFVRDEDLYGLVLENGFHPLNDWVQVSIETWQDKDQGVIIPEDQRRRPRWGKVLDWGPGKLVTKGDLIGCRLQCSALLQMPPSELAGAEVWWDSDAEVIELGHDMVEFLLIRTKDLMAVGANNYEQRTKTSNCL